VARPGEEPKLHLFGQLKRITRQWLDTCLVCKGDTYPALLMYQELADMACNRSRRHHPPVPRRAPDQGAARSLQPDRLDRHVRFNTSKTDRWETEFAIAATSTG
jgi:type III restriction enzyme